jgi:DNA-directed RNA polymerase subunit RPC12/RpoP
VPGPAESAQDQTPKLQFISVDCRVCGTRLTGRSDQVGKKIKCPDCGAGTVLPEPAKPKPKNMPAALEGEQYELWDFDDQPLPSELMAAQPNYIAVTCKQCGTLMQATENQVGQQIACPDCGAKHTVPVAPKPTVKPSVLVPDRETPKLDPASAPGERPHLIPRTIGQSLAEQEQEAEYKRALEKSQRTGRAMEIDVRGRPILPSWPLISGVLPFLFSAGVPAAWLGLSAGFLLSTWILVSGLEMALAGGMAAIAGMCFFAIGVVITMVIASACASCLMQIVMESSNGARQVQNWPSLLDWFGSFLYLAVASMVSAIPGWAIGHIPSLAAMSGMPELLTAVSICLCLPVVLLSQLDIDSPWGILSGRVLASMARCPFSWAFFYLECLLLLSLCGAATYAVAIRDPHGFLWLMPLYVVALILFARLLGRLGWRLAEALSIDDRLSDEDERGPKNYNPPRGHKAIT